MLYLSSHRHSTTHFLILLPFFLLPLLIPTFALAIQHETDRRVIDGFQFDLYHQHRLHKVPFIRLPSPVPHLSPIDAYGHIENFPLKALELAHTVGSKTVHFAQASPKLKSNQLYFYSLIQPHTALGTQMRLLHNELAATLWNYHYPSKDSMDTVIRLIHIERLKWHPEIQWNLKPLESIITQHNVRF